MARSTARAAAMQMIYETISGGQGGEDTLKMVYDEFRADESESYAGVGEDDPKADDRLYIENALQGVLSHVDELDEKITKASNGWRIERMPHVDLTILRLAVWEILYADDVPGSVAISEAVELANRYSDPEKSSRFINGVLGTILRSEEAEK